MDKTPKLGRSGWNFYLTSFLFFLLLLSVAHAAPTVYEQYATGDDMTYSVNGTSWYAQSFTAGSNHNLTAIRLKIYQNNIGPTGPWSLGLVTVSIRSADTSGCPTGPDLTSGTLSGTITTNNLGEFIEISMGTPINLTSGTRYAIVVRNPEVNTAFLQWRQDEEGGYPSANACWSSNSGSTWNPDFGDFLFQIIGDPEVTGGSVSGNVAYTGIGTGLISIAAFDGSDCGNGNYTEVWIPGPGPYTLSLNPGTYHICACRDTNGNGTCPDSGEPASSYDSNPVVVAAGAVVTGINISIEGPQPPVATSTVPTMTEWGTIMLTVLLGIGSVYYLRRRRSEN